MNKRRSRFAVCSAAVAYAATLFGSALSVGFAQETQSVSNVDSILRKSLAHVIVRDGKSIAQGTGFCIGSHDGTAYILTNKHVVGDDRKPRVVLLSDPDSELYGRIDRVSTLDAAVIAIDNASCTPVRISSGAPAIGTQIAIAGFPAFQIAIANNAVSAEPSFHIGTIAALPGNGAFIEYDAQTDHGNSGSPLVDARTGVALGLVTYVNTGITGAMQNNLALSMTSLSSFIANSHANVAFEVAAPSQTSATGVVIPSGATVAEFVDAKCGSGVSSNLSSRLKRAIGELSANDYSSTITDERAVILSANQCALQFSCPGASCNEPDYVIMMWTELLAQQNLRIATARTNGDLVNAIRNELYTTTSLCSSANIMNEAQPYQGIRETMKASLDVSRKIRALGPFRGIVDAPEVRDCASKMGV